ncbi:MAG: transposase [Candidatus Cloacimonetes bacterium]|nr:transposase [Candidatus Cloacimonadota bacterium]
MRLLANQFEKGGVYHLYNHSAKGALLFNDRSDYQSCVTLLNKYIDPHYYAIIAYCLMPNHYHILLQQLTTHAVFEPFSRIWHHYSTQYNTRHHSYGSIFCQKLQHVQIREETYLLNLCAYIHMNPVAASLADKAEDWEWSNYLEWIDKRPSKLFNPFFRDSYFGSPKNYHETIDQITWDKLSAKYLLDK